MCGIAGIIHFGAAEDNLPKLRRMILQLQHRGPDASGVFVRGAAGLAHARLSIIDLSGGDQPIHNEERSVWVTFNGEIFNYPEIREDLEARGHRFYTRTDTETLVHLYEEEGEELFRHLNGQFAFAIWDDHRQRLLLGRDRMGIRPLFYFLTAGRIVFGSEVKALFADPSIPRRLDAQTISDVFSCWTPLGERTVFEGICSLPPGHYATRERPPPANPDGDLFGDLWPVIRENPKDSNHPWIVWSRSNGSGYDLGWSRWTTAGWSPLAWVEDRATAGDDLDPSMALDGDGRPHIAWCRGEAWGGKVYLSPSW